MCGKKIFKKKILMIQHAFSYGGSFQSFKIQLQNLPKQVAEDYEIEILLNKPSKKILNEFRKFNFKINVIDVEFFQNTTAFKPFNPLIILFNFFKIFLSMLRLAKFFKSKKYDVVYFNSYVLAPYLFITKLMMPEVKNILHIREVKVETFLNLRNKLGKYLIKKYANKVIFLTYYDKKFWGSNGVVIYNSYSNFLDLDKKKFSYKMLFLGGFSRIKGLLSLKDSLEKTFQTYPNSKLIFVGSQEESFFKKILGFLKIFGIETYSQKVKNFLDENKKNIIIKKTTKSIDKLYCDADILLIPSGQNHFPRPYIEASCFGIPSILIQNNYYMEFCTHEKDSLLSKPEDFHISISKLFNNKTLRTKISKYAMANANERFNVEKNVGLIWSTIIE